MATLERATQVACAAHAGQCDKAGEVYVLHPLRVMLRMSTVAERIAAVLHDVVEDSDVTLAGPVKRADIEDNLDLSRIAAPTDRDRERAGRYERALEVLAEYGVS